MPCDLVTTCNHYSSTFAFIVAFASGVFIFQSVGAVGAAAVARVQNRSLWRQNPSLRARAMTSMNQFELDRLRRIEQNNARMAAMGITTLASAIARASTETRKRKVRPRVHRALTTQILNECRSP